MHLRALKLNGFKSFADAIDLRFDKGVTAVVGPNGCGKSNIADAIRWVLGEQSAKALRGGKMHDVIFEGTDKRKPLPMCEVSLLLADCEEQLGTEFNEIEITRRVSRDGGSDYLINGRPSRLKDIQKLFMDTGIGRTSYSIMAQGQIDQILSSKPEERRAVFEEAAGITKYKSQRREAMSKLERVDLNLSRVNDVIAEVGRQINSLRRQASKALRYKRLNHRLRHLDLAQAGWNHEAIGGIIGSAEKELSERSGGMQQYQADLQAKEKEVTQLKLERSSLLQRVQEAQQAVFDLRSRKEQAISNAQLADTRRTGIEERMEQARRDIAVIESQLAELSSRANENENDKQLQLDILGDSDGIFQARNRDLAEMDSKLHSTEARLHNLKQGLLTAESNLLRLRNERSGIEVEDRTAQARAERLNVEFVEQDKAEVEAHASVEVARAQIQEARQKRQEAQDSMAAAQDELAKFSSNFRNAQQQIQELDRAIAQKTARQKLLQQLEERHEGFGQGAKVLLDGQLGGDFQGRNFSALSEGLKVDQEYVRAVEALLGASVEAVLVDDSETARVILDQLARRELGRACLRFPVPTSTDGATPGSPQNLVPGIRPAVSAISQSTDGKVSPAADLLTGCFIADSAHQFLSFWKDNPDFKFFFAATREGELIDRRGVMSGGQQKGGGGILQRAVDLKDLATQIEEEGVTLAGRRSVAEQIGVQLDAVEKKLETLRREHVESTQLAAAAEAGEKNALRALEETAQRRARLERERVAVEEIRRHAAERLQQAEVQFAEGEGQVSVVRARIEETERDLVVVREERDTRREAVGQARFDLAEKRQRLEVLDQGLSEIEGRRSSLVEAKTSREQEIDTWLLQKEELSGEAQLQRNRAAECATTLAVSEESVGKVRGQLISTEETLQILEGEQSFLREQADEIRTDVSKIEINLADKRARLQFLSEEVIREHQVEIASIDWRFELWMSARKPAGLHKLDLDEAGDEEANGSRPSDSTEATVEAENGSAESTEASGSPEVPTQAEEELAPTAEELAALETPDWSGVKNEVDALRKRLHSMGPVNLVAIEEYGELKQRFEFLNAQSGDLANSKEALLKAIDEINRTSQQQFADTFAQIRTNFTQTFHTLFGGGHADLKLLESEDVLESGIEIVAQPPGTRLRGISLLSGGQRTMTAVALLFAIYMVKPSPFCVLDELDAPLDESNIGRFTKLLGQFTTQSQFIIITHNKRTISASQSIYGITMEERGVSKVVSMRFHSEHQDSDIARLALAPGVPVGTSN